jgi:hypothetical protein
MVVRGRASAPSSRHSQRMSRARPAGDECGEQSDRAGASNQRGFDGCFSPPQTMHSVNTRLDLRHPDVHILLVAKDGTDWRGNGTRLHDASRHLEQERLEKMVVGSIEQGDTYRRVLQCEGSRHASRPWPSGSASRRCRLGHCRAQRHGPPDVFCLAPCVSIHRLLSGQRIAYGLYRYCG